MPKIKINPDKKFREEIVGQMLTLATSGLGLVAALAWNELIKTTVNEYIKPLLGKESGVISQLVYAVVVTLLAVTVTYNLTKLTQKEKEEVKKSK